MLWAPPATKKPTMYAMEDEVMARFCAVEECLPALPIEDIALNIPIVPKQMTPIKMIWRIAAVGMVGYIFVALLVCCFVDPAVCWRGGREKKKVGEWCVCGGGVI